MILSALFLFILFLLFLKLQIDLPTADVPEAKLQMQQNFEIDPQGVLAVSAASGLNVDEIFPALVERIPPYANHLFPF
jgi:translation elongation factor EF-4